MLSDPLPFAFTKAKALGVSCRSEVDSDRPFLLALYRTTREDELALVDWPEATKALFIHQQFSAQHSEYGQSRPNLRRLLIGRSGTAIGRFYIDLSDECCHLVDISLLPVVRGQGIGSALISDLLAYAATKAAKVTLSVIGTNPAKQLYARMGFNVTGATDLYHQMSWSPPQC